MLRFVRFLRLLFVCTALVLFWAFSRHSFFGVGAASFVLLRRWFGPSFGIAGRFLAFGGRLPLPSVVAVWRLSR